MGGKLISKKYVPTLAETADDMQMGCEVKDIVTGVHGLVTSRRETLSGMIQYGVETKGDGQHKPDSFFIDWAVLDLIGEGISSLATTPPKITIKLGQSVRDKITGFFGIATEIQTLFNGCVYICIEPPIDMYNQLGFDSPVIPPKHDLFPQNRVEVLIDEETQEPLPEVEIEKSNTGGFSMKVPKY